MSTAVDKILLNAGDVYTFPWCNDSSDIDGVCSFPWHRATRKRKWETLCVFLPALLLQHGFVRQKPCCWLVEDGKLNSDVVKGPPLCRSQQDASVYARPELDLCSLGRLLRIAVTRNISWVLFRAEPVTTAAALCYCVVENKCRSGRKHLLCRPVSRHTL